MNKTVTIAFIDYEGKKHVSVTEGVLTKEQCQDLSNRLREDIRGSLRFVTGEMCEQRIPLFSRVWSPIS